MEQIGPYQIQGELGRGGMGIVYRGLDPVIGRTVAVKTLRSSDLGDSVEQEKLKERLFREAKSAGMLSHPGIVTIYQAGQDKDVLFIAMEFIDGPNLADALARARPGVELTLRLLKQAAEALDYAHSKGVIHRDIKPANLLLQSEGRLKVADFGIAKIAATNLTKTGTTVGSPAYMSPEQIRAMPMDGRADQYSLGVVAFELLTGVRPYDADTMTSLVFKVVFEQPDFGRLATVPGGLRFEPVFWKVLAKTADERYPNCMAFWEALSNAFTTDPAATGEMTDPTSTILSQPKPPVAPPVGRVVAAPQQTVAPAYRTQASVAQPDQRPPSVDQIPAQPPPATSRRGLILGGIGGLVVVLGGGGYWMWSHRTVPDTDEPEPTGPGERTSAVPITKFNATYTPEALKAGIEGTVLLRLWINAKGKVDHAEVIRPLEPGLDKKALEAVRMWTFEPAKLNGKPVRSRAQVEQTFVIPK